jgi:hypothetical protein
LRAGGIDVDEARKLHQLEIVKSENVYLLPKEGHFDAEAMLQLVPALLRKGYEFGFRVTRFVAHLEHTTRNEQDVDAAMEYESRLNYILPTYPHPIVCAYDLNKVDGGVVRDVLRTHPMVVVEGVMKENPFFLPPDRFLREVRERRRNQKKPQ